MDINDSSVIEKLNLLIAKDRLDKFQKLQIINLLPISNDINDLKENLKWESWNSSFSDSKLVWISCYFFLRLFFIINNCSLNNFLLYFFFNIDFLKFTYFCALIILVGVYNN